MSEADGETGLTELDEGQTVREGECKNSGIQAQEGRRDTGGVCGRETAGLPWQLAGDVKQERWAVGGYSG